MEFDIFSPVIGGLILLVMVIDHSRLSGSYCLQYKALFQASKKALLASSAENK